MLFKHLQKGDRFILKSEFSSNVVIEHGEKATLETAWMSVKLEHPAWISETQGPYTAVIIGPYSGRLYFVPDDADVLSLY